MYVCMGDRGEIRDVPVIYQNKNFLPPRGATPGLCTQKFGWVKKPLKLTKAEHPIALAPTSQQLSSLDISFFQLQYQI